MHKSLSFFLTTFTLFNSLVFSDIIYIVGADGNNKPTYWTISPSGTPSNFNELDTGSYAGGQANNVTFSQTQTAYIVGQLSLVDTASADYWTLSPTGSASLPEELTSSDIYTVTANAIAFTPSGVGYIVGKNSSGSGAYWTISPSGSVSPAIDLTSSNAASNVAFSSLGNGYIVGFDDTSNSCYWTVSNTGLIAGPFGLVGGEVGGSAGPYGIAISPSGTAYIVGTNTAGFACYWTISPLGVASSAQVLSGGDNSSGRSIAFMPSGAGIIAGQASGNTSSYWLISADGSVGSNNTLTNGTGNGSFANAVAFSSTKTAYIVGLDNLANATLWTVPLSGSPVEYYPLNNGGNGLGYGVAIYLQSTPSTPNSPTNLSAKYVTNDFALLYEECAILNWSPSTSTDVTAYRIYKNGLFLNSVNSSTTQYQNHDQNRSATAVYTVTAINSLGYESAPATITLI